MKRTKSKKLSSLIFKKSDLEAIWSLIERNATEDEEVRKKEDQNSAFPRDTVAPQITIKSEGELSTEAETNEIFNNDVIDNLKTEYIEFQYSNYKSGKRIIIKIEEAHDNWSPSTVTVRGNNISWVDATFTQIERILNGVQPQSKEFHKYNLVFIILLAFSIGYSFFVALSLIFPTDPAAPQSSLGKYLEDHPTVSYLFFILPKLFVGGTPAWMIVNWAGKLWPLIEFDFGPEHLKTRKKLRKRFGVIISLFVLPIILEILNRFILTRN